MQTRRAAHEVGSDGYTGAQYEIVLRCCGALTIAGSLAVLALLPAFPPTHALGVAGWPLVIMSTLLSLVSGIRLARLIDRPPMRLIGALGAIAIVQLGSLEWLAGGGRAPYTQLLLLPGLGTAAGHRPRRCLAVAGLMDVAALSPALYSHIDVLGRALEFGVATFMVGFIAIVFTSTRDHRVVLQRAGDDASELAHHDALTGLPNRRAFDAALASLAGTAAAPAGQGCLLFLDVDRFKSVNDTFGHLCGDAALAGVAAVLTRSIREPDLACRWAGDEFAVLARGVGIDQANRLAGRIREAVAESCRLPDGSALRVSVGVSVIADPRNVEGALERADDALRAEKVRLEPIDLRAPMEHASTGSDGPAAYAPTSTSSSV